MIFFFFFGLLCGMRDLSSLIRDQTCAPEVEMQSPNHWTAREFPRIIFEEYIFLIYSTSILEGLLYAKYYTKH